MADTHTIRKMTTFLGCVVFFFTFAGCSYFENPITWEESARSSELVGEWATVEGSKEEFTANITRGFEGLEFEVTYRNKGTQELERSTFTGHLRASNDLDVLQLDLHTLEEHNADSKKKKNNDEEAYYFLRVELAGNKMLLREVDFDKFGVFAESVLQGSEIQMSLREVSNCLDKKLHTDIVARSLPDLLRERDWNQIAAIVQLPENELEKFRHATDGKKATTDPFHQVNSLRSCVASKLPSEQLEKVFESASKHVFVGERFELERM